MAMMAAAAPYLMGASAGMGILGGFQQAGAQRAAGDAAYQSALSRASLYNSQAQQEMENASTTQGAGEVQAVQERNKATLLAGRAKAVMAASGAGVDPNLVAGLVGQGNFNADTDMWSAGEKARGMRNQSAMDIYSANVGIDAGAATKANDYAAADNTIIGAIGKSALSFASYYGGGKTGDSIVQQDGGYNLASAPQGGYGGYAGYSQSLPGFDGIA